MKVGILGLGLIGGSMARAYAKAGHTVYAAEKDRDMLAFAQLAGTSMKVIDNNERAIAEAIKNNTPVLVRGTGALCAAKERGDAEALSMAIEKNCRAALAAIGSKPINPLECALMRLIYLKKYSKQSK